MTSLTITPPVVRRLAGSWPGEWYIHTADLPRLDHLAGFLGATAIDDDLRRLPAA